MKLEIDINDNDYYEFVKKAEEIGMEPNEVILNIINLALREKKLRAKIKVDKYENLPETKELTILAELEEKIKKHGITQNAIALYLNTNQSTISRAFKSHNIESLLAKKYLKMGDKLLVHSYIMPPNDRQFFYLPDFSKIECKSLINEEAKLFLDAIAVTVQKNFAFPFSSDKFEQLLCNFINTELYNNLNFKKLYQDIEMFIEAVNEITDNYFYKGRL